MSDPRFLTDEHVPGSCISVLRSLGYEVSRAKDEFPEGTTDATLLEFAAETALVVLTENRGESLALQRGDESGVMFRKPPDSG